MASHLKQDAPSRPNCCILFDLQNASGLQRFQSYPKDLEFKRVFKLTHNELLKQFGSKQNLQEAVLNQDPEFGKQLVPSLTKELLIAYKYATTTAGLDPARDCVPQAVDVKKRKKGIHRFLPKIPKITIYITVQ